ncbi:hypothetical protein ACTHSJ_19010 [Paenibacillus cellulositrophicus]|uniref:hypothetical protein n=1 Tax=Paenibacillus cellulositrophicus TaxID=562959 RepID=UPI003F81025F
MRGKLPFPKWILKTQVKVYQSDLNEDGEPVEEMIFDGLAFYDETARQVLDAERRLVQLSGKVIIQGNILPDKLIQGYVMIGSVKRTIFRSARPRNPDGSVFSTELELS